MLFSELLLIVTIVATCLMALYVGISYRGSTISRSFILLISSFAFWAIIQLWLFYTADPVVMIWLRRLTYACGFPIGFSFLYFALVYPYPVTIQKRMWLMVVITLSLISTLLLFTSNVQVFDVLQPHTFKAAYLELSRFIFFVALFFIILIYSFVVFYRKYVDSSGVIRKNIKAIALASLIPIFFGTLFNVLMMYIGIIEYQLFGPSTTMVFTLAVFYLIFIKPRLI